MVDFLFTSLISPSEVDAVEAEDERAPLEEEKWVELGVESMSTTVS